MPRPTSRSTCRRARWTTCEPGSRGHAGRPAATRTSTELEDWRRFTKDELLTTVMLYWVTDTVVSSLRPYVDWPLGSTSRPDAWEGRPEVPRGVDSKPLSCGEKIEVPTGVALFSLAGGPREWGERAYSDIRRWKAMPRGGHFGPMEEPELLAEEIQALFRPLRR